MDRFKKVILGLLSARIKKSTYFISFVILGIGSTIWFLIRVLPKPERVNYPCIKAAAPFMSSFFIWLIGVTTSVLFIGKMKNFFMKSKYILALICLVGSISFGILLSIHNISEANANILRFIENYPPNEPMGEAKGVKSGRVVWIMDNRATNENCTNTVNYDGIIDNDDDIYYLAKNNNELIIKEMISDAVKKLIGTTELSVAWDSIFHYHNRTRNNINQGYMRGEKVFIKTNNQGIGLSHIMNPDLSQDDANVWGSFPPHMTATSPYSILAAIHQLVHHANVPQDMIYVGDPHMNFNDIYFNIISSKFPDVHYMGVNANAVTDCEKFGRTKSIPMSESVIFYSDKGTILTKSSDKIYEQMYDATYIINLAALKSHIRGGITLFSKSHFGTHTSSDASHLHNGLVSPGDNGSGENTGYGKYRVLVDLMSHDLIGGKTMLYILDALWGGKPHELHTPRKYDMSPFNGDYTSSILVSIDPVAISSVGYDILRTEYNIDDWGSQAYPNFEGTDDHLHQAADSVNWPDAFVYDPEGDDSPIKSQGVHEHWNNALDRQYSRNLNPESGKGIELVFQTGVTNLPFSIEDNVNFQIFPNPVESVIHVSNSNINRSEVILSLYNMEGKLLKQKIFHPITEIYKLPISELNSGIYLLNIQSEDEEFVTKILIK